MKAKKELEYGLSTRACVALRAFLILRQRFPDVEWFHIENDAADQARTEARTSTMPLDPQLFKNCSCERQIGGHGVGVKTQREILNWLRAAGVNLPKHWPSYYEYHAKEIAEREQAKKDKEEIARLRTAPQYIRWLERRGYKVIPP